MHMYKKDSVLNNPQGLICYQIPLNIHADD